MIRHVLMLRYSKDGGNNWSDWREAELGGTGRFLTPAEFRRFGRATQEWVFEVAVSSPMGRDLIGAAWLPEQTEL